MSKMPSPAHRGIKPIYVILAFAFLFRLGWVLYTPALPTSDFSWYNHRALEIVEGHGYSVGGTPTAHRLPGFSLFLAAIYLVFGRELLAAQLFNVLLGVLTVYLTYLLARKAFAEQVALVAGAVVALMPSLILYAGLLASENLATPLLLSSLALFLHGMRTSKMIYIFLSGILLGLTVLIRPATLLLPIAWLLYVFYRKRDLQMVGAHGLLLGIPIILCLLPWVVRNYLVFERFIPLSTDSGSVLLISFNADSSGRYSVPQVHQEISARAEKLGWDEYQHSQALQREAFDFVRQHPWRAIMLAPLKLFQLFRDDVSGVTWNFEETSRPSPRWLRTVLIVLAQGYYGLVLGLAFMAIVYHKSLRNTPWSGLLLTPILYWSAFHLVFFGDDRYHLPILPIIVIFSAFGALQIVDRWGRRSTV
jgi:4-amino-4-deoxy-L-arabinose transferase-like glycosyltransferase